MIPTIGRIVHYMLSATDADQINRRRTDGRSIAGRMTRLHWPEGAQAHIGNPARSGQVFPMVIVKVTTPPAEALDAPAPVETVSGQVFLDGTDIFWAQDRQQVETDSTDKEGLWFEPPRVNGPGPAAKAPEAPSGETQPPI